MMRRCTSVRHRMKTVAHGCGEAREGLLVAALCQNHELGIHALHGLTRRSSSTLARYGSAEVSGDSVFVREFVSAVGDGGPGILSAMGVLAESPDSPLAALDRAGYRLTGPRRAVAGLIAARNGHFTAADLVGDAAGRRLDIGRATIFRTLDVLESVNAIERIDLPSGDHAYIACEPAAHHHHVVCARCGRAADVDDAGLAGVVSRIAAESGYQIDDHRLELFGLCPACQAGRGPRTSG